MRQYNVKFVGQSKNAGESMPLGGRDVGCNVWVENDQLYLYMAQSGAFDEEGNMIKAGRLKIGLSPNPFMDFFSQELKLEEGSIEIIGKTGTITTKIQLWIDVKYGILHVEIDSEVEHQIHVFYENWRNVKNGYQYPDMVLAGDGDVTFYHKVKEEKHFWDHIHQEGLETIAQKFPNVQKNLTSGGRLQAKGMFFAGKSQSVYANLPCDSYMLETKAAKQEIKVFLHISQSGTLEDWKNELDQILQKDQTSINQRQETLDWWAQFWNRSYVHIKPDIEDEKDEDWQVSRNYQLFRYMLGCNAYGRYPTKFNGGLFTVDPVYWGARYGAKTPDERDWGGIVFTAQNQRHMYWPMLKSGDFDMMAPQFEFYFRLLEGAMARSKFFFGVEDAACIPEQTDANGLSAFYGLYGLDYPMHIRYHYVTSVEFGYMMLKYIEATGERNRDRYINFISTIINFYDQMYRDLDENGKRIIFPSTAQETYHKAGIIDVWGEEGRYAANYNAGEVAVTNPADVIYALRAVIKELLVKGYGDEMQRNKWEEMLNQLPPVPKEIKREHTVIAPCELPKNYVKTNCEFPQLYATFPYHEIGIGENNREDLQLAIDTYNYAWDDEDQLMNLSWMHVGLFTARMGLAKDAYHYQVDKLKDSGRRFPAFWGPGHDYVPDHNWGGSDMCGLQEMLLQNFAGKIYLLPAWPKNIDVQFKLWVENNTYIEVTYQKGDIKYTLSDESRKKDIIICI